MSNKVKSYAINSYEWLMPTGDASKILIRYSIADDEQDNQSVKELSIVIQLSRNAEGNLSIENEDDKAKVIIAYLREEIKKAIINGSELSSEMTITSYDNMPTNPDIIELRLGDWDKVTIERKMGFLPS